MWTASLLLKLPVCLVYLKLTHVSGTPRSASNENPLAISGTQSYPRAGDPEQPSYSAGANGYAYGTAITTGLESMPANLEEPRQPRGRGSERPHASRRGTDMRPNVTGRDFHASGAACAEPSNISCKRHKIDNEDHQQR